MSTLCVFPCARNKLLTVPCPFSPFLMLCYIPRRLADKLMAPGPSLVSALHLDSAIEDADRR